MADQSAVSSTPVIAGVGPTSVVLDGVLPRLHDVTNELTGYSYRILDQCVTLCDAVDEIRRMVISVPPFLLDGTAQNPSDSLKYASWADQLSAWRSDVSCIGCQLVQLTAKIRLSPLAEACKDDANESTAASGTSSRIGSGKPVRQSSTSPPSGSLPAARRSKASIQLVDAASRDRRTKSISTSNMSSLTSRRMQSNKLAGRPAGPSSLKVSSSADRVGSDGGENATAPGPSRATDMDKKINSSTGDCLLDPSPPQQPKTNRSFKKTRPAKTTSPRLDGKLAEAFDHYKELLKMSTVSAAADDLDDEVGALRLSQTAADAAYKLDKASEVTGVEDAPEFEGGAATEGSGGGLPGVPASADRLTLPDVQGSTNIGSSRLQFKSCMKNLLSNN